MNKQGYFLSNKDIAAIESHYIKYFTIAGANDTGMVMHEMVSDGMHIDLVHYTPTEKFPYNIVATMGMSAYTMHVAPWKNIELIMFLPKDWKMEQKDFSDEKWYWPIRALKSAARLPYMCSTFLTAGHTFSNDEKNTPFDESTTMCSGLITFPTWLNEGVFELKYGGLLSKKKVNFLCLTTINQDELNIIRKEGSKKFLEEKLVKDGKDDLLVRCER